VHTKEKVIVPNVIRHPVAMAKASKVYTKATHSMIKFLIAENDQMVNEFQEARKIREHYVG